MADPNTDSLLRRIAELETQVALLTQAIKVDRGGNVTISAPGGLAITSGGATTISVGSAMSVSIGGQMTIAAGNKIRLSAAQEIVLEARYYNVNATVGVDIASGQTLAMKASKDMIVRAGKTLSLNAADAAELKSGGADLDLKKDGTVNLKGRDIAIQASGGFTAKASGAVTVKGSKILQN
ncbi:DUF2345 domain-containing protein [Bosea sp. BH3]|uniref:DUF2345 domain-containing protein n=1 Tax=Bosea sp. BH3 TaxID=2871701 RepID=UPI0021CAF1CC|nr:DUF2345 domain-containing protein [Bosea sp. BH3]MCU4182308.1 DUF2345 domain-containing protein [Bosea sp. BH3]